MLGGRLHNLHEESLGSRFGSLPCNEGDQRIHHGQENCESPNFQSQARIYNLDLRVGFDILHHQISGFTGMPYGKTCQDSDDGISCLAKMVPPYRASQTAATVLDRQDDGAHYPRQYSFLRR